MIGGMMFTVMATTENGATHAATREYRDDAEATAEWLVDSGVAIKVTVYGPDDRPVLEATESGIRNF